MPTISVIVPVYKVEKYIHRCVDSILGQTFTDFELILVDDGSPDNCGAICDEYAQKDGRVRVIHQENGGLSAARNAGIDWAFANSDSQWLTFVDSDDWVHPEYLERLANAAYNHNVKVCMCSLSEENNDEKIIGSTSFFESFCQDTEEAYATQKYSMTACGKLYDKETFLYIRYPVGKLHEDVATTYKLLFQYAYISVDLSKLYYYRKNDGSITRRAWNPNRLDEINSIEEQILFFNRQGKRKAKRRLIGAYYWVLANQLAQIHNSGAGIQHSIFVKQKLWCALIKYCKEKPVTIKEDAFVLEQAFPTVMKLYWFCKAVKSKLL